MQQFQHVRAAVIRLQCTLAILLPILLIHQQLLSGIQHCQAEEIQLLCDEHTHSVILDDPYYCTVTGLNVSHSDTVSIHHKHESSYTHFMKFYDSHLLYIPHGIFEICTSLRSLDVSASEIIDIPRFTFNSAANLTYLNMSKNNLTAIATSVFTGAGNLMSLDLTANFIKELDGFAFAGLTRLTKLHLGDNALTALPKSIFADNKYLEWIDLHGNLFEYIQPAVFDHLTRLRDVNLATNYLQRIHPDTFSSVFSLQNLWLAKNSLTEFKLSNKSIMYQVHLDANQLTELNINITKIVRANNNRIVNVTIANSEHLELLELSHNNISNIANLTKVENLLELNLSYNPIGTLNTSTFNSLKRLRALYLRGIGLTQLSYGMFAKLTKLEKLDLSYNNLTRLNLEIFVPYLSNLQVFYVGGNNLTELQGKFTFSHAFEKLLHLGISNNRFNCTYLHWLLTPPNLATSVNLYVERGSEGDEETAHIRDVTCVSEVRETLQHTRLELHDMTAMQKMLQSSLDALRVHEKHLEIYMSIFKLLLLIVCLAACLTGAVYIYKQRHINFQERRGGSIVFHSSNTINTNIEQ